MIAFDTGSSSSDPSPETKTLKFSLAALNAATAAANGGQSQTAAPGQDVIPPLRNPPVLESAEDLSALSNLNEPSGMCDLFSL